MVKAIKYSLLSCCFFWLTAVASGQSVNKAGNKDMPEPYLFAEFYPAIILFKTGTLEQERMNYNVVKEEMVYVQDGNLQVLDRTGIDTIYLAGKKMVPFNQAFCEVLTTPPGMLYIRHRYRKTNRENSAGYGGTTQTSNTASLRGTSMLGDFHVLDARTKYEIEAKPAIWVRRGSRFYNANNLRQLQKAFPDKKDMLKQLVKEQKTDFTRPEDVITLLGFF